MSATDQALISSSSGASEFIVSLLTNLILGLVSLLAISILRRRGFSYFFDVRRSDHIRNPNYVKGGVYYERPPRQDTSFFGWIWQTLAIPENVVLRSAGLDAVISLRFYLRMGMYLTIYAIAAFIVLVPIQATSADNNGTTGFNALSILSIDTGSHKLWAHLVFMYLSTFFLFKILHSAWFETISLKQRWLANQQLLGQRLTVLISRIPTKYSTTASLYALFQELYPGHVAGAYVVQSNPRLTELYSLREEAVGAINAAKGQMELDAWSHKHQQSLQTTTTTTTTTDEQHTHRDVSITRRLDAAPRPKMRLTTCGPKEVDVIDYYTDKLKHYDDEIAVIFGKIHQRQYSPGQIAGSTTLVPKLHNNDDFHNDNDDDDDDDEDDAKKHRITTPHVGFVTFTSAVAAASAINAPISESVRAFEMTMAPEPNDINWSGINTTPTYKQVSTVLISILVGAMVVFYTIPVTFISAILTLEALSEIFPFLTPILTMSPVLRGIISGLLPSLAMLVFMALLPKILLGLGYATGLSSRSEIEMFVFKKYFLFQFINFFLIACFSSTVFSELNTIIDEPGKIPELLAAGLPQSALLFINYIQMRAFFSNIFGIIDVVDIPLNKLFYLLATTPKEIASSLAPTPQKYGTDLPEAALIFIIAFTFGTIQPMMLIFAALYFFTIYFSKRYSLLWISVNPYQTGGGFWPLLYNRIMIGVIVGQLCVLGLFALKEQPIQAILMVPLIIISIGYWYRYSGLYESTEHRLTLISARVTDAAMAALNPEQRLALVEGYDLPSGPAFLSVLPFLIPEKYGDTVFRDNAIQRLGIKDQSFTPDLSSYENFFDLKLTVKDDNGNDVVVSRDFVSLPDQFHGDDLTMDPNYKEWLQHYDLITNQPRDIFLSALMPLSWVRENERKKSDENITANKSLLQNSPSMANFGAGFDSRSTSFLNSPVVAVAVHDDNDVLFEDQLMDSTKLTLEQRILIQQQVFRWKLSQRTISKNINNEIQPTNLDVIDHHDGNNHQNDIEEFSQNEVQLDQGADMDAAMSQLPLPRLNSLPSDTVITNPFILRHQKSIASRQSVVGRQSVGSQHSFGNQQTAPMERDSSQLSGMALQVEPLKIKGVCQTQVIPPSDRLELVMMRYFSPETNPLNYSNVSYRVWGDTYITYRAIKEQRKIDKKNKKKEAM